MATSDEQIVHVDERALRKMVDEAVDERMRRERAVGVSVPEAAHILRVSTKTIWRKIKAGEIQAERVLGHVRITQDEMDRLREGR